MFAATQTARNPDPLIRYSFQMQQHVYDELRAAFPTLQHGECIRFAIAYTLQKKPRVALPIMIEPRPGHQPHRNISAQRRKK